MENTLKYYEILGLKPGATEEEIKQAYRDLVRVWHPDRFEGDLRLQEKAQQKIKEINLAYEFLKLHWYIPPPRDEQTYSEREDHYEEYYEEEQDDNRKDWVPAFDIGKNVKHWYSMKELGEEVIKGYPAFKALGLLVILATMGILTIVGVAAMIIAFIWAYGQYYE